MTAWAGLDAALAAADPAPAERVREQWRPLLEVLLDGPYAEDCEWTFERRCPVANG